MEIELDIELHVVEVETERRWDWRQYFDANVAPLGAVLGTFLSWRDDETFVWLQSAGASPFALPAGGPALRSHTIRGLRATEGSTLQRVEDLAVLGDSAVLEIRQYRLKPGTRHRFAQFLFERTLAPQRSCGMRVHGPFDDLADENVLTWFRGFSSLGERDRRKANFYQNRLWLEELEAEAFSMIEDYKVMLVSPV